MVENKICENSDAFFLGYTSQEGNQRCLDCNAAAPQWASVTYGILICMNCAGVHRKFGASISQVRSINLDLWTEKHIQMMKVGGNLHFKEFLEKYNLENEEARVKYQSKAALFYRRKIAMLCSNQEMNEEDIDYDEGRQLIDGAIIPTKSP